jgi:hypothetical protein
MSLETTPRKGLVPTGMAVLMPGRKMRPLLHWQRQDQDGKSNLAGSTRRVAAGRTQLKEEGGWK